MINFLGNNAYVATQPGQSFNIPFSMQNGAFSASGMVFSQNNGVFGVNSGSVLLPGAFAGGTITVGGVTTNVVNNIGNYVIAEGNINLPMTLADDDDNSLFNSPRSPDASDLERAFKPAYVQPVFDLSNPTPVAPFVLNLESLNGAAERAAFRFDNIGTEADLDF